MKYVCDVCGYEYDESVGDPDNGIAAEMCIRDRLYAGGCEEGRERRVHGRMRV